VEVGVRSIGAEVFEDVSLVKEGDSVGFVFDPVTLDFIGFAGVLGDQVFAGFQGTACAVTRGVPAGAREHDKDSSDKSLIGFHPVFLRGDCLKQADSFLSMSVSCRPMFKTARLIIRSTVAARVIYEFTIYLNLMEKIGTCGRVSALCFLHIELVPLSVLCLSGKV